ncbi:MAG: cell envelope biogenesis protein TolA [Comamonadaceae bacterium]|nr:MAG: cell envelope biogenesis protein TolA [Comamonadaceae bacterium]
MSKVLAVLIAGFFAAGAYAQSVNPQVQVPTNTKSQNAAEAKKSTKASGQVRPTGGDFAKTPEGGAVGTDKASMAGERRAETRDARRPGKKNTQQGGTVN